MQLTLILIALLALISTVRAVHYCAFASTISCTGDAYCCDDNGGFCCGQWPVAWGWSVQWVGLPSSTEAQAYGSSSCSGNSAVQEFGPGTQCRQGGGVQRFGSINWVHLGSKKRVRVENATQECTIPSSFQYTDASGTMRVIKLASKEDVDAVGMHSLARNWTALASFPKYNDGTVAPAQS
ncbi:hypothetical protein EXIGLDRAFT_726080 [Exidia glandulosa HHB12029]|uniref:Uncharacterized protein n=1 Tax=Exidia glandulosa HHB12029 TaxID=1314781 RepID=A0A165DWA9_EXIGL|nr:hypothetical protein EXIGLDRAFT_726080 [Exidia glandulosa HHB12029]